MIEVGDIVRLGKMPGTVIAATVSGGTDVRLSVDVLFLDGSIRTFVSEDGKTYRGKLNPEDTITRERG